MALASLSGVQDTDGARDTPTEPTRPLYDLRTGRPIVVSPSGERRAYLVKEVAELLSVSTRHVWRLIKLGDIKTVRLAGREMVLAEHLDEFIEALKAEHMGRPA